MGTPHPNTSANGLRCISCCLQKTRHHSASISTSQVWEKGPVSTLLQQPSVDMRLSVPTPLLQGPAFSWAEPALSAAQKRVSCQRNYEGLSSHRRLSPCIAVLAGGGQGTRLLSSLQNLLGRVCFQDSIHRSHCGSLWGGQVLGLVICCPVWGLMLEVPEATIHDRHSTTCCYLLV